MIFHKSFHVDKFFSFFKIFAAAVFPILYISASFLHPSFGIFLAKSKNLIFSSDVNFVFASLPLGKFHGNKGELNRKLPKVFAGVKIYK